MRKHSVVVAVVTLCAIGFAQAQQRPEERRRDPDLPEQGQSVEIPSRIDFEEPLHYGIPLRWISATELTDPAGFTLDMKLLGAWLSRTVAERIEQAHEEGMRAVNEGSEPPPYVPFSSNPGMRLSRPAGQVSSFQELVDTSRFVAIGVVEESVGGFSDAVPGQMLRVRVQQWHGRAESPHPAEVLFFWPGGEIEVGYATVLASMEGVPRPPNVGERIVLFPEVGHETSHFMSFLPSRFGHIGAAAKFGANGRIQVSGFMAQQIPEVARMGSFQNFSTQLQSALGRSAIR